MGVRQPIFPRLIRVCLPVGLDEALADAARTDGETVSGFVRSVLREELRRRGFNGQQEPRAA